MADERPPHQDREFLRRLYDENGLTQGQIAEELGCSRRTIISWMDHYDLGPGSDAPRHRLPRLLDQLDADEIGNSRSGLLTDRL